MDNFEYDAHKIRDQSTDFYVASQGQGGSASDILPYQTPSYAEVTPSYFDTPRYKSVAILPNYDQRHSVLNEALKEGYIPGPPKLERYSNATVEIESPVRLDKQSKKIDPSSSSGGSSEVIAPERPFLVMATHFETTQSLSWIVALVERTLSGFGEVSYELLPKDGLWNGVYLLGSTHCKFQVHVYFSHGDVYIIEANRLLGDATAFRNIFARLKAVFCVSASPEELARGADIIAIAQPLPDTDLLSDADARKALQPIVEMAKCGFMEAQLEACRVMCDLSVQDDMQQHLCDIGGIQVLVALTSSPCEWTRQHVFLALANLSGVQSCQEAMIDAGILPVLLTQAKDGPYNLAEMSRESARILANLSDRLAARVVSVLGHHAVNTWIKSVDKLTDERLRVHAVKAKKSLSVVFAS